MKILILDDTKLILDLYKTIFMMQDAVTLVRCTSCIRHAKFVLELDPEYDLIVSDYKLKGETGKDFLEQIRLKYSYLLSKTVIMSAGDSKTITKELLKDGFDNAVYTKPVSLENISKLVNTFKGQD